MSVYYSRGKLDFPYGCIHRYIPIFHLSLSIAITHQLQHPGGGLASLSSLFFILKTWFIMQSYLWAADQMIFETAWEGSHKVQMLCCACQKE